MLPGRCLCVGLIAVLGTVPARADTIQVVIDQLVFSPAEVRAKPGDTIEWVNKDGLAHTATVRGGWDVMIEPNASARLEVKTTGRFDYYCRFHPNMTGRLTVVPP